MSNQLSMPGPEIESNYSPARFPLHPTTGDMMHSEALTMFLGPATAKNDTALLPAHRAPTHGARRNLRATKAAASKSTPASTPGSVASKVRKQKAKKGHAKNPFYAKWYESKHIYSDKTLYNKITIAGLESFLEGEGVDVKKDFPLKGKKYSTIDENGRKVELKRGWALVYKAKKVHQRVIDFQTEGYEMAPNQEPHCGSKEYDNDNLLITDERGVVVPGSLPAVLGKDDLSKDDASMINHLEDIDSDEVMDWNNSLPNLEDPTNFSDGSQVAFGSDQYLAFDHTPIDDGFGAVTTFSGSGLAKNVGSFFPGVDVGGLDAGVDVSGFLPNDANAFGTGINVSPIDHFGQYASGFEDHELDGDTLIPSIEGPSSDIGALNSWGTPSSNVNIMGTQIPYTQSNHMMKKSGLKPSHRLAPRVEKTVVKVNNNQQSAVAGQTNSHQLAHKTSRIPVCDLASESDIDTNANTHRALALSDQNTVNLARSDQNTRNPARADQNTRKMVGNPRYWPFGKAPNLNDSVAAQRLYKCLKTLKCRFEGNAGCTTAAVHENNAAQQMTANSDGVFLDSSGNIMISIEAQNQVRNLVAAVERYRKHEFEILPWNISNVSAAIFNEERNQINFEAYQPARAALIKCLNDDAEWDIDGTTRHEKIIRMMERLWPMFLLDSFNQVEW